MKQYNETTRACVVYAVIGEVRKTQFSQKFGDHSNFSQQFKLSTAASTQDGENDRCSPPYERFLIQCMRVKLFHCNALAIIDCYRSKFLRSMVLTSCWYLIGR